MARDEREMLGPLQGLIAGLQALPGEVEAAFVTACDVPFLRPAWIRRLFELRGQSPICVPEIAGELQTLSAIFHRVVLLRACELLANGSRGPRSLFAEFPMRVVREAELADIDPSFQSIRNVNTPEDYAAALRDG